MCQGKIIGSISMSPTATQEVLKKGGNMVMFIIQNSQSDVKSNNQV